MDDDEAFHRAEADCRRLTIQYGRGIDLYDDDMVLAVFTDDATWQIGKRAFRTPEQRRGFLAGRDRSILFLHVMTNFMLDRLDGDEASGTSCWTAYEAPGFGPIGVSPPVLPRSAGIYHDRFRRSAAGWRIAERRMQWVFRKPD